MNLMKLNKTLSKFTLALVLMVFASIISIESKARERFSFDNKLVDAADSNSISILNLLLNEGSNPDQQGRFQTTALHRAAFNGHNEAVKLLIESGADINARDFGGATALHMASRNNLVSTVRLLFSEGAELDIQDNQGFTPIHRAISAGNTAAAILFLEAGADINTQNSFGNTPLIDSVRTNNARLVKELLIAGADRSVKNNQNQDIIDYALMKNNDEVNNILSKNLAELRRSKALDNSSVILVESETLDDSSVPEFLRLEAIGGQAVDAVKSIAEETTLVAGGSLKSVAEDIDGYNFDRNVQSPNFEQMPNVEQANIKAKSISLKEAENIILSSNSSPAPIVKESRLASNEFMIDSVIQQNRPIVAIEDVHSTDIKAPGEVSASQNFEEFDLEKQFAQVQTTQDNLNRDFVASNSNRVNNDSGELIMLQNGSYALQEDLPWLNAQGQTSDNNSEVLGDQNIINKLDSREFSNGRPVDLVETPLHNKNVSQKTDLTDNQTDLLNTTPVKSLEIIRVNDDNGEEFYREVYKADQADLRISGGEPYFGTPVRESQAIERVDSNINAIKPVLNKEPAKSKLDGNIVDYSSYNPESLPLSLRKKYYPDYQEPKEAKIDNVFGDMSLSSQSQLNNDAQQIIEREVVEIPTIKVERLGAVSTRYRETTINNPVQRNFDDLQTMPVKSMTLQKQNSSAQQQTEKINIISNDRFEQNRVANNSVPQFLINESQSEQQNFLNNNIQAVNQANDQSLKSIDGEYEYRKNNVLSSIDDFYNRDKVSENYDISDLERRRMKNLGYTTMPNNQTSTSSNINSQPEFISNFETKSQSSIPANNRFSYEIDSLDSLSGNSFGSLAASTTTSLPIAVPASIRFKQYKEERQKSAQTTKLSNVQRSSYNDRPKSLRISEYRRDSINQVPIKSSRQIAKNSPANNEELLEWNDMSYNEMENLYSNLIENNNSQVGSANIPNRRVVPTAEVIESSSSQIPQEIADQDFQQNTYENEVASMFDSMNNKASKVNAPRQPELPDFMNINNTQDRVANNQNRSQLGTEPVEIAEIDVMRPIDGANDGTDISNLVPDEAVTDLANKTSQKSYFSKASNDNDLQGIHSLIGGFDSIDEAISYYNSISSRLGLVYNYKIVRSNDDQKFFIAVGKLEDFNTSEKLCSAYSSPYTKCEILNSPKNDADQKYRIMDSKKVYALIGEFSSPDEARTYFARRSENSNLDYRIAKVGIENIFLLQLGPVSDGSEAKKICNDFSSSDTKCKIAVQ
jgi:hypothetical protein